MLLTGATGLLGRFILRRLLMAGHDVAVIVRPGATAVRPSAGGTDDSSADHRRLVRQRIESVLQPFEVQRLLPRPRAIVWDFADESAEPGQGCGIAPQDLQWLQKRDWIVIHCAASIRFETDSTTGEPYRTNVDGTRNILNLCKELSVTAFHYVSTAYVGQHRSNEIVREVSAQAPGLAGNDYERSKIQAEQLVTQCSHVGSVTIHRPSIVIGDSQTGFTSTYHGFYAPLQIGWQFSKTYGFSEPAGQWFRQQLGLDPSDRKNLVPVDWVAEGIALTAEQQNRNVRETLGSSPLVLHWTNPEPVACQVMQSAIMNALERSLGGLVPPKPAGSATPLSPALEAEIPGSATAEQFQAQMKVYRSYFQSDPTFDRHCSEKIAGQLACPKVDYEMLSRLSDWAIRANFGWPKQPLPQLPNQQIAEVIQRFDWSEDGLASSIIRCHILGPGSPETMYFSMDEDRIKLVGGRPRCSESWKVSLSVLADCVTGTIDLNYITKNGYWLIEGPSVWEGLDKVRRWINHIKMFLK